MKKNSNKKKIKYTRGSKSFEKRPMLSINMSPEVFQNSHWSKKELMAFCSINNIPSQGGKMDIIKRVHNFLKTGKVTNIQKVERTGAWDSASEITVDTPVINFKNDEKTREFFVSQVGEKFKVNQYLRNYSHQQNDGSITYGDLVEGWKNSIQTKNNKIGKQFMYNQFQRDFYTNEKGATRSECYKAWEMIKSVAGQPTYHNYVMLQEQMMKKKKKYE